MLNAFRLFLNFETAITNSSDINRKKKLFNLREMSREENEMNEEENEKKNEEASSGTTQYMERHSMAPDIRNHKSSSGTFKINVVDCVTILVVIIVRIVFINAFLF